MKAIILAAGMGTRLRPLTLTTPKPLIKINDEPLIERQIKFLLEKGIEEIVVVTGYLHEKFDCLKEKYGVTLVHNDKYAEYNNIYTMYLVKEYLSDAYVLEGDVYIHTNIFDTEVTTSTYFSSRKESFENEWMLKVDENNKLQDIVVGSDAKELIMCGVSYWSAQNGELLNQLIEETIKDGDFTELFWDDLVKSNLSQLDINVRELKSNELFEIDSVNDLEILQTTLGKL